MDEIHNHLSSNARYLLGLSPCFVLAAALLAIQTQAIYRSYLLIGGDVGLSMCWRWRWIEHHRYLRVVERVVDSAAVSRNIEALHLS